MVQGTLILTRKDITGLLTFEDYVEACRDAFRAHALGLVVEPALMHLDTEAGEFHIKGGGIRRERTFGTPLRLRRPGFRSSPGAGGFCRDHGLHLK